MKQITPHLWFDKEAKEAAEFYTSVFPDSEISYIKQIHNTPSGDCDTVSFTLGGQPFMAISAGPFFKFNPSISFMVNFDPSKDPNAKENLDKLWHSLSGGGSVLMPLQEYPFSKHYGWVQDKYGVSWQLILTNPEGEERPFIIPSMMFTKEMTGKAEEAREFYTSVFKDGPSASSGQVKKGMLVRYPEGAAPDEASKVMFSEFYIMNTWFTAMDSGKMHDFSFNEAVSLLIPCDTQEEIDYYWEKLSADPNSEQCGWLKDKYGVSWQVWPTFIGEIMKNGSEEQIDRVTQAFLQMKKFDIATLEKASKG